MRHWAGIRVSRRSFHLGVFLFVLFECDLKLLCVNFLSQSGQILFCKIKRVQNFGETDSQTLFTSRRNWIGLLADWSCLFSYFCTLLRYPLICFICLQKWWIKKHLYSKHNFICIISIESFSALPYFELRISVDQFLLSSLFYHCSHLIYHI